MYEKWKQWQYYVIIGVISLISLFFLPMLGSEVGLGFRLPNTFAGWIVYISSKLLVAVLNLLIFHCFILQGKVNIRNDERFKEANNLLRIYSNAEELKPKSPQQWSKEVYGKKGVTIFITSTLSAVGLTQAVLTFDWVSMLTYLFTVLMGLIFGVLQMNQTEIYWTEEYLQYAKQVKHDMEVAEKEHIKQENDSTSDIGGADVLEPVDSDRISCTDSESLVVDNI